MMDAFEKLSQLADGLEKGQARGGKYYRRVPTGNPKRPWRYYYSKKAYDEAHGDEAHRNGKDEQKKTFHVTVREEGRSNQGSKHVAVSAADKDAAKKKVESLNRYYVVERVQTADEMSELAPKKVKPFEKMMAAEHGRKLQYIVDNGTHEDGDYLARFGFVVNTGKGHRLTAQGERILEVYKMGSEARKSEDSMSDNDIPQSALLSKGLYSFTDYEGKDKPLPDDWLADYVDAFIEEAYEHERREQAHRDPNLLPADADPAMAIARPVYNEFIQFCTKNKNLMRAKKKLNIDVDYIEARMRAKNLLHVDSENQEANNKAAVAGYHEQPLTLSRDAHGAYVAAEAEKNVMVKSLGSLETGPEYLNLGAGDNPLSNLRVMEEKRMTEFAKSYGASPMAARVDPSCPYHGDGHRSDLNDLNAPSVHGVVCTCGS